MSSDANYLWHYSLFNNLCLAYRPRFVKVYSTEVLLLDMLSRVPQNIKEGLMIEPQVVDYSSCIEGNSVAAYRNYYRIIKLYFSKYTNREVPEFISFNEEN